MSRCAFIFPTRERCLIDATANGYCVAHQPELVALDNETCCHCGQPRRVHGYSAIGRSCQVNTTFRSGPTRADLEVALATANRLIGEAADEAKKLEDKLQAVEKERDELVDALEDGGDEDCEGRSIR